jgi:hypothetical protein
LIETVRLFPCWGGGENWIFLFLQCVATKTTDAAGRRNSFLARGKKMDRGEDKYTVTRIREEGQTRGFHV